MAAVTSVLGVVGQAPEALAGTSARLFAFVPSDEKSRDIERLLAASLTSVELTVFGRAKDLEQSVQQVNPDAVLAPVPTLIELGLTPTLKGQREGSTTEPYVLITVGGPAAPRSMAGQTVGALGIMGHSAMARHCGQLLGTGEQKVKTVTKYADLLPLLQFGAAKGVVLPRRFASVLTSRSALALVQNDLPEGRVGLTSVAVRNRDFSARIVAAMNQLSRDAKDALGVEAWQ
jgi:hypothetical protein